MWPRRDTTGGHLARRPAGVPFPSLLLLLHKEMMALWSSTSIDRGRKGGKQRGEAFRGREAGAASRARGSKFTKGVTDFDDGGGQGSRSMLPSSRAAFAIGRIGGSTHRSHLVTPYRPSGDLHILDIFIQKSITIVLRTSQKFH